MSENLVNKLEEELKEERAAHQATKNLIKTLQDSISTHLHKIQEDASSLEAKKYKIFELKQEIDTLKARVTALEQENQELKEKLKPSEMLNPDSAFAPRSRSNTLGNRSTFSSSSSKKKKNLSSRPSEVSFISNSNALKFSQDDHGIDIQHTPSSSNGNSFFGKSKKVTLAKDTMCTLTILTTHDMSRRQTLRVDNNITIKDIKIILRVKLADKIESPDKFQLFRKKGSNFVLLEDEKPLSFYKKLLDPKNSYVYFQTLEDTKKEKKNLKKITTDLKRSKSSAGLLLGAVEKGDLLEVTNILENGTDLETHFSTINEEGLTAMHVAIKNNDYLIVEKLIQGAEHVHFDFNTKDSHGWTPLHYAAQLSSKEDEGILKLLLSVPQVDVSIPNDKLDLALHIFAENCAWPECTEIVEQLISNAPTSINKKNKAGETPLHKAMRNRYVKIILANALLKRGALPNEITNEGKTPLHLAFEFDVRKELIKPLLHAGADVRIKDKSGVSVLDIAETKSQDVFALVQEAEDLANFLTKLHLEEFYPGFLKVDCNVQILSICSEFELETLMNRAGITAFGTRLRLKTAVEELKKNKMTLRRRISRGTSNGLTSTKLRPTGYKTISHSELEFTKQLGEGASGLVFKGVYKGCKVAIKVLKVEEKQGIEEFKKEIQVLSLIDHPNVVHFYGACFESKTCVVMEWCRMGNLTNYLKRENVEFTWENARSFAKDIAQGISALHEHEPPIFHRDIKADNILISEELKCKVGDMGLARFNTHFNQTTLDRICGTFAYLAPERYKGQKFTEKSDIYALGIVFWELAARVASGTYQRPYSEYAYLKVDFKIALHAAEKNLRPSIPSETPSNFKQVIQLCWDADPNKRPAARQIAEMLSKL